MEKNAPQYASIAQDYYQNLLTFINAARVTEKDNRELPFYDGIARAAMLFFSLVENHRKAIFIGNGASASISSHMAADFSKNGGMRAMAFNDIALLTAIGNDIGYQAVFETPMGVFADKGDLVCAISSSGRSENILRAIHVAKIQGCQIMTLSGFQEDNPLRLLGDLNFYVPAPSYGHVEVLHHSICHCILDTIMKGKHG